MSKLSKEDEKRQQQYAKRLQQQQKALQRQREKQLERLADKDYQQAQQEKQRQSQVRQAKKQQLRLQEKLKDPVYLTKQFEKQRARQKKQQLRQQQKPLAVTSQPAMKQTPIKSKGLKGRAHNALEKRLAGHLAEIGCICCLNKGWTNTLDYQQTGQNFVSLHHVDGRTKPWAHAKVLPLCHYHHQTPAPTGAPEDLFPLHGNAKTRWETVNGSQQHLLKQVYAMIKETPPWLIDEMAATA